MLAGLVSIMKILMRELILEFLEWVGALLLRIGKDREIGYPVGV